MAVTKGIGICLGCGESIKNNSLQIPDAMKVISLELEAYNRQSVTIKGPELWLCLNCVASLMKNFPNNAKIYNDARVL